MSDEIQAALWGAIAGGTVALAIEVWYPIIKRMRLARALRIEIAQEQPPFLRLAVTNGGFWTIHSGTAYLTLDVGYDNLLAPPGQGWNAYIKPGFETEFRDQCLCWSVRSVGNPNPARVDIFAKESQTINVCYIGGQNYSIPDGMMALPSEEGWYDDHLIPKTMRAFLKTGKYVGRLKVTSEDTDARFFDLVIDPTSKTERLKCTPVPYGHVNSLVTFIKNWWTSR